MEGKKDGWRRTKDQSMLTLPHVISNWQQCFSRNWHSDIIFHPKCHPFFRAEAVILRVIKDLQWKKCWKWCGIIYNATQKDTFNSATSWLLWHQLCRLDATSFKKFVDTLFCKMSSSSENKQQSKIRKTL